MKSKAFQAVAFLVGFPAQTDLIVIIQTMSRTIVKALRARSYKNHVRNAQNMVIFTYCAGSPAKIFIVIGVLNHVVTEEAHCKVVIRPDNTREHRDTSHCEEEVFNYLVAFRKTHTYYL
jgi:kynureninase